VFAFDEFGRLTIRPHLGAGWSRKGHPDRLPSNYDKLHGVRSSTAATPSATTPSGACPHQEVRRQHPGRAQDQSCREPGWGTYLRRSGQHLPPPWPALRSWAACNKGEPCFIPTYSSWASPIEAQFGPLRTLVIAGSVQPDHPVLARRLPTICDGATPTHATPTSSPPNVANAHESAARKVSAGAGNISPQSPDQPVTQAMPSSRGTLDRKDFRVGIVVWSMGDRCDVPAKSLDEDADRCPPRR
jgi:hypothetical protein